MLARLVLLLPVIGAGLRLLGFRRTRDLLARRVPTARHRHPAKGHSPRDQAERVARLVAIAAHHGPYRATCLRRSLALWWLLRRRGMPAELRIGVRKDSGGLEAHAWVDLNGQAVNDLQGVATTYSAFTETVAASAVPRA